MASRRQNLSDSEKLFRFVEIVRSYMENDLLKGSHTGLISYSKNFHGDIVIDTSKYEKQQVHFNSLLTLIRQIAVYTNNDRFFRFPEILDILTNSYVLSRDVLSEMKATYQEIVTPDFETRMRMFLYRSGVVHVSGTVAEFSAWDNLSNDKRIVERKKAEADIYKLVGLAIQTAWLIQDGWISGRLDVFEHPQSGKLMAYNFFADNYKTGADFTRRVQHNSSVNTLLICDEHGTSFPLTTSDPDNLAFQDRMRLSGEFTVETIDLLISRLEYLKTQL
jgi:hypothetical protein